MPGKKSGSGLRLTARRKFQIYVETRGKDAPVGEIMRRWNLTVEQLREIERIVEEGATQALKVRGGHRTRPKDVTPEAFAQLQRELLEKEKALAELAVELMLVKKGPSSGCAIEGPRTPYRSNNAR
jgi:hypothetical protein